MASVWAELKRRNVVKVAIAYAIVAWILAQLAEFATGTFGAPAWVLQIFVVFLLLGLPLAMLFAWAYELTPTGLMRTKDVPAEKSITQQTGQRLNYLLAGLLAGVLVGSAAVWLLGRSTGAQQEQQAAMLEIRRLMDADEYAQAFELAEQALPDVTEDPALQALWAEVALTTSVTTAPPGADVYMKAYDALDGDWRRLGRTSIDEVRLPWVPMRMRLEMPGYETVELLYTPDFDSLHVPLVADGSIPPRMVRVPASELRLQLTGYDYQTSIATPPYLIDQYEVTNREYKEFVDAGGYDHPGHWQHEFVDAGETLSWEEAMSRFRDSTNRPGPATWQGGSYPTGAAEHPVGGVSWYEAAAYLDYRGKQLPSVYHWLGPGGTYNTATISPLSVFDATGPAPVGASEGVDESGTYDKAGNVKEWVSNAAGSNRYILGGGWEDPVYRHTYPETRPPFDRSPMNGFRGAVYLEGQSPDPRLFAAIDLPDANYADQTPVDDATFALYRSQFDYDPIPLDVIADPDVRTEEQWRRERVSFNAAYGNERMSAYVYLPRNVDPPYQAVVFFPGTGAIFADSIDPGFPIFTRLIDFVIQSGRVVVMPVLKSTFERKDGLTSTWPSATRSFTEHVIYWTNDVSRTIDYLETRDDVDTDRLAFYGFSWGGRMGARIPAIENRFKAVVLVAGALALSDSRPEVNQVHYAPRVTAPVLMLNGRHDYIEPVETSQIPLFNLFGTPAEHKRHVIFEEAGHTDNLPRAEMVAEILGWLDRYLGPVN